MSDLPMGWLDTPSFRVSSEDCDDIAPRPCADCGATADENACEECGECVSCHCTCPASIPFPFPVERAA